MRHLAVVAALLCTSAQGWAQADTTRTEARERFDRGLKLFDQGDDEGALAEFSRAYALIPNARVLYNIGLVQAALHRPVAAVDTLAQLLKAPGDLPKPLLDNARVVHDEQAKRIATLNVTVNVPRARIEVDGVNVARAPLDAPLRLAIGAHHVAIVAPGHRPSWHGLTLAGGESQTLNVELEAIEGGLGNLELDTSVPGAQLYVRGKMVGTAPLSGPIALTPGRHELEVRRDGYRTVKRTVVIRDGEVTRLSLKLEPSASPAASGRLSLSIAEAGAVVFVDGVPTAQHGFALPSGPHRLRVERDGFFPFERGVEVPRGRTANVAVELEPTPEYRARYRDRAGSQRFWSWVAIGGGAAVLGGGVGFLVWNTNKRDDAQAAFDREAPRHESTGDCWPGSASPANDCRDLETLANDIDAANNRFGIGWGLVAVGAASVGAGTFFLLSGDDPERYEPRPESDVFGRVQLTPVLTPQSASVGVSGAF
ncbi:MAG: PEGA domain-containing protein [Myxococcales bacterium]|nr:PEGA domain-containing protein [Myxococcales bacterium]MCB9583387.1 PEGA domain-containing protein [Polyangiaceae bacterium]